MTEPKADRAAIAAQAAALAEYRERRNQAVIAAYIAGETRGAIGARHDISPRMVSRIVAAADKTMTPARMAELNAARARRGGSSSGGRPRVILLPEPDMRHYKYLRTIMGAAFARQAMGISA